MLNIAPKLAVAKVVNVAVGAIVKDGRVLLAKRAAHQHQGGLWEFPGGKVEAAETVQTALARELKEELDISPKKISPLIQISHQYADKAVLLDVWRVDEFSGEPRGLEGQPLKWVPISQLGEFEFPAANKPIVSALMLPKTIAITPSQGNLTELKSFVASAIDQGADSIQIRAPELASEEVWNLYQFALERLKNSAGICWLNSAHVIGNDGRCQLSEDQLAQIQAIHWKHAHRHLKKQFKNPGEGFTSTWSSVACHSLDDLVEAATLEFDCATLSPVNKTQTHPDATALGWEQFSQWVAKATIPVYALGGVTLDDKTLATQAFAQGIAGISLFNTYR